MGLGDPLEDKHEPTRVGSLSDWVSVSAGGVHTLGIRSDRGLWAWGYNGYGQLGLGDPLEDKHEPTRVESLSDWVSVSAGDYHTLGIRSDGGLWAWGYNGSGELGLGDTFSNKTEPTRVGSLSDWVSVSARGLPHPGDPFRR